MNKPTSPEIVRATLRRLTAPHALAFGNRLLACGQNTNITFREFVAVARESIVQRPEQSAVYLAALVALDMTNEDSLLAPPAAPSVN